MLWFSIFIYISSFIRYGFISTHICMYVQILLQTDKYCNIIYDFSLSIIIFFIDEKGSQERNKTDIIYPDPEEVAVYYCNRAACNLALGKFMEVTSDCTFSLRLKEDYLKAYMRRAQAFEKLDKMEEALKDYEKIVELDVNNYDARKKAMYLSKIVAERQEKLKEETLGKLKDLGNSLLGHVGLSLDNFKMEKNEGGSYNISFQR